MVTQGVEDVTTEVWELIDLNRPIETNADRSGLAYL